MAQKGSSPAQLAQRRRNQAAIAAERRSATHCINGHEFTEENTYVYEATGRRECRTCRLATQRYYRALLPARMAHDPNHPAHGKLHGYTMGKCRCKACRLAGYRGRRS